MTAGSVVVIVYDHGNGAFVDSLRRGVDVLVVDRRGGTRSAEDLVDDLLGTEWNDLVGDPTAVRRVLVRAERAVQSFHGEAGERHHRDGDQDHPPSSD